MRDIAREELIAELLALKPEFEREGILHIGLFGSRARQDNRPDSDIDLLVEVDEGRTVSLLNFAGIYGLIEERLGLETSLVDRRGLHQGFLKRASRDLIPVF
jgi:predicted nucleotidyltransferase